MVLEYYLYDIWQKNEKKQAEGFSNEPDNSAWVSVFIFSLVMSIFSIYLSWTCNSNAPTFLRVIYAFFAWFFGVFYLIFYFFYNYLGKQCGK